MTISSSFSRPYSKELTQGIASLEGQPVHPNLQEGQPVHPNLFFGQPVHPNLSWDLKLVSAIEGVFKQATEPTLALPMVLASPAYSLGKVGALRGLLGATTEAWWNRGLAAQWISSFTGFIGETTFFSTASRGLTHLLVKPVDWDIASQAHDWVGAGLSLSLLKTGNFLGRRAALSWRGLSEAVPQLWNKADHSALFWSSQASGYLSLVGAHRVEEKTGYRQALQGGNIWLDTFGDYLAMGLGAFGGRSLLGTRFAALEQRLSLEAQILHRQTELPRWLRAESTAMAGAMAGGGALQMPEVFQISGDGDGKEATVSHPSRTDHLVDGVRPTMGEIAKTSLSVGVPPTAPQTAGRARPKFEVFVSESDIADKPDDFKRLDNEILAQQFLTQDTQLNLPDKIHFTRFVLDRLPDYPALLRYFILTAEIGDLETALHHFCRQFSDESDTGLKNILRSTRILPSGASMDKPLSHETLVLMRNAKNDAVNFLDRIQQGERWIHPNFSKIAQRLDKSRLQPQTKYHLTDWQELQPDFPELNETVFLQAYEHMVRERILTQKIYQHYLRDEFAFAVTDGGHEVLGAAAAFALRHEVNPEAFAISPHYRTGTAVGMWAELEGYKDFFADYIRQQLSKITDKWSKGRQTASHFNDQSYHILPGHSEVGRNLPIAVGYARALQQKWRKDAVVYAELGDGSMALSDLHEAMTSAVVMGYETRSLPVVMAVVDNQMAISVEPISGRALTDLSSYAKAFGAEFYTCNGNDFLDVYQTYRVAISKARALQKPVLIWVQNLPRLNNHSSAAQFQFDFKQHDPLLDFSEALVQEGILRKEQVLRRNPTLNPPSFFNNHQLGEFGNEAKRQIDKIWEQVAQEPEPTLVQTLEDVRLEFPRREEPPPEGRPTGIIINGAIRAALRDIIQENPLTWVNGQDTGMKGGVMQATAGLWELFPRPVTDAPINEPAIMATALGFALHEGAIAFPEIQFGDYSTSGLHWLIKAGNFLWTSGGTRKVNWNLRLPVEPGIFGAVYHSTPLEGLYAAIPGLTILSPSTTRDAYGLIRSAAEYAGPVIIFEPKALYRKAIGDAFANEPRDEFTAKRLYNEISIHRGIPDIPKDFRIPLGKAAIRRSGKDLTLVTWGLAHYETLKVLDPMVEKGIDVELIDLRTLVPPDMETVRNSVRKTGRLLIAHQDRVFSSLGREIQGQVHEAFSGEPIRTKVLGMEPVPGIPQNRAMEHAVMVTGEKILQAALDMMGK